MAATYSQQGALGNGLADYLQFLSNTFRPRNRLAPDGGMWDDGLGLGDPSNGFGLIGSNALSPMGFSATGMGSNNGASSTNPPDGNPSNSSAFYRLTPADWSDPSSATVLPRNSDQLGAENYQGQQAAAGSLAAVFANPRYQSNGQSAAAVQPTVPQVPQMSQWNPTVGDNVRRVWNDIRTSQPVESILGRTPDETAQMLEPRPTGLLPNTAKALQDWQVVGNYSPADLLPQPQTVAQGMTTAVLRQINLNNLLAATGVGEVLKTLSLAQDTPRSVALTKALLGAYTASNGAQAMGQSAGDIVGNPNLPPGQTGADLANIGLGGAGILGSVFAGAKPGLFASPDFSGSSQFPLGKVDLSDAEPPRPVPGTTGGNPVKPVLLTNGASQASQNKSNSAGTGSANSLLQPGAEYSVRINPVTGRQPMAIDTSTFTSGETTMNGGVRSSKQFWSAWLGTYGQTLSDANFARINVGRSPVVDEQWIRYFPEHSSYMGETLIHHHLDYGPQAIPLPQTVHRLQPGWSIWHQ